MSLLDSVWPHLNLRAGGTPKKVSLVCSRSTSTLEARQPAAAERLSNPRLAKYSAMAAVELRPRNAMRRRMGSVSCWMLDACLVAWHWRSTIAVKSREDGVAF